MNEMRKLMEALSELDHPSQEYKNEMDSDEIIAITKKHGYDEQDAWRVILGAHEMGKPIMTELELRTEDGRPLGRFENIQSVPHSVKDPQTGEEVVSTVDNLFVIFKTTPEQVNQLVKDYEQNNIKMNKEREQQYAFDDWLEKWPGESIEEGFGEETYDEMVEYWKHSLSQSIVQKDVFTELYNAAGQDIDTLNSAIEDEAYSIADTYHGSGEGIGTSDVNHFIASIGRSLGVDDIFGWYKKEGVEEEDNAALRALQKGRKDRSISVDDHAGVGSGMKSDDEMERDKVNRYSKYNKAIRNRDGLGEAKGKKVTVPVELSNPDPNNPKATSADAEAFLHALGPDDEVDDYVVDPETGEVLFEPFMTKRGEGMDKFKSAREYHDQKETWVPSIYGADNQDDAWEELGDLRHGNNNAARFYNIVWRNLEDLLGDPRDLGTDAEDWGELDYDTGYDVPVAIKRKDGKKLQEEDYDNFRTLASLVKHATGNISLSMMGTTDKGTVARFTPTLM